MSPPELPPAAKATSLVDVTAWMSLLMAALGIAWCVLQLLAVIAIGRMDIIGWLRNDGWLAPEQLQLLQTWAMPLSVLMLAGAVLFLAVSWGFFKRREWGRQGLIVCLLLVALANFAFLPLINGLFDGLQAMLPSDVLASPAAHELRTQLRAGRWLSLISAGGTAIGVAALHAWLVVKLRRPQVRALFH